ncbi:MAG: matrixin family metalloprotease [Blastocatellia bacterium]|nr:matrixin family metalloprotease [Blastocatellia bacterium]
MDYWCKQIIKKPFNLFVYDSLGKSFVTGTIVGRSSKDYPFNTRPSGVIGVAPGPNGEIFIKTDYEWALGERMDANSWADRKINLSHVIAHEAGHWFGFDHVRKDERGDDCKTCIMYPSIGGGHSPKWQTASKITNSLFEQLARKLQ